MPTPVDNMSTSKILYCIVDDTALITNISEIEPWVLRGAIALVVPLYTLERLHLLKKDTSQIGQNARKVVKFLDEATSNTEVQVFIQEPDDQYQAWSQVEAHYREAGVTHYEEKEHIGTFVDNEDHLNTGELTKRTSDVPNGEPKSDKNNQMAQMVVEKLTISKEANTSPTSTPPLSPSSSGLQSSKTSPEVKSATMIANDLSPVPPSLKGLINPVVWYTYERSTALKHIVFLTNSSDTAYLARDFGVTSKNIHQLRATIGAEVQEAKNHSKYRQKKHGGPATSKSPSEPQTLFRYEEEDSDEEDEEVIFKPRGHGSSKGAVNNRGGNSGSVRSKGHGHSPANSLSGPAVVSAQIKPQIPTEEIDPDSFDRGSFARGSTPLVGVGNHASNHLNSLARGSPHRGNYSAGSQSRGGFQRGSTRGFDRGSGRGRGRLFVP